MIVVGINIALWFEGWFADLEDAETEQQYLAGLRDDLQSDITLFDAVIESNTARLERLGSVLPTLGQLAEREAEAQADVMFMPSTYHFFEPSDFTYRSMQESGDFRLLSDAETKTRLLRLVRRYREIGTLQENFMQALDDGYIPIVMSGFDILQGRVTDPDYFDNQLFLNFFPYTYQDTEQRLTAYRAARDEAQELVELIATQTKD